MFLGVFSSEVVKDIDNVGIFDSILTNKVYMRQKDMTCYEIYAISMPCLHLLVHSWSSLRVKDWRFHSMFVI